MRRIHIISLSAVVTVSTLIIAPSNAQRQSDPNLRNFYMARQQVEITDDSPVIINRQNGGAGAAGQGAMPNGPVALPKAGWVPYSQSVPGLSTSLPKVNNGVPAKAPPTPPSGLRAKSGKLKAPAKASTPGPAVSTGPSVKAYTPYKQYVPESPASGSASMNSNTNVRGNLLHWARPHRQGN